MTAKNTRQHFFEQIDKHGPVHPVLKTRCHLWTGFCNKAGYGRYRYKGEYKLVHRMIFELKHGKLPKSVCVLHRCDNPPCLRDEHLFKGSKKMNTKDCVSKQRNARGSSHGCSKLSDKDIKRIRKYWRSNNYYRKELAAMFGVHKATIGKIIHRRAWTHL